jgi:APA family basic amino acid/polyamine antiporter
MLPVLFACGGWQQGAFVAGAARRPLRDVPLGIALGVVVVVVAYLAINLAYLDLLGFDAAASSPAIAAEACRAALAPLGAGDVAARVMAGAITVSALGIMNTILLAPPWVLATMAERGVFLRACAYVHPRWHSPLVGVLVQGGCAMALLVLTHLAFAHTARGTLGTLDFLLTGVVFVDWLFFALCGLALTVLARRRPGTLLGRASPALGMVFTLFAGAVTAGAVATAPWPSLVGAGLCALGLVPYVAFFRQGI